MTRMTYFGLVLMTALSAACGGVSGGDPGDNGGTAGAGGGDPGGSGGSGGGEDHPFDAKDLQLNDVSVLFPLPATNQERDAGMLDVQALLPSAIYDSIGHVSGRSNVGFIGSGEALYKDLRVVALRIDPCFAALEVPADAGDCENQVRLVVQEVVDGSTSDAALHLFYSISRDEVLDLVRSIGGLRQSLAPGVSLGRLQPHPIMVEQGLTGSMSKGVRDAILHHASTTNLIRVTRMTESNGPFWNFSGFDIVDGKTVPMHIPTLPPGDDTKQLFARDFGEPPVPSATPPSGSDDDFMKLAAPVGAQALSHAQQAALFARLLRVENPAHHSPNTVDCASCHIATPTTKLVAEPLLGLSGKDAVDRFEPSSKLLQTADLVATFENDEPLTNVHAFSYTERRAGISQRTVNESAAVVSYLSTQEWGAK
ncbi:MAG TPA: hypothetical protein VHB79_37535 [Polyangiaceae bacterium]|nr:hypothetical protein [Polyangiaceae bacterium]